MRGLQGKWVQELVGKQVSAGRCGGGSVAAQTEGGPSQGRGEKGLGKGGPEAQHIQYQTYFKNNDVGLHLVAVLCLWPRLD